MNSFSLCENCKKMSPFGMASMIINQLLIAKYYLLFYMIRTNQYVLNESLNRNKT